MRLIVINRFDSTIYLYFIYLLIHLIKYVLWIHLNIKAIAALFSIKLSRIISWKSTLEKWETLFYRFYNITNVHIFMICIYVNRFDSTITYSIVYVCVHIIYSIYKLLC